MDSTSKQIETIITSGKRGAFFFPADFASMATPELSTKTLQRMAAKGILIRATHGVYYYPRIDKKYGLGVITPTTVEIAEAIAKRDRVRIWPTGAFALNALGLSAQVPANAVFITDGAPRKISVGKGRGILFKHTDNVKNFAYTSKEMQLVVAALKEIGEGNVTDEQLVRIKEVLTGISQEKYLTDITLAPAWIRRTLIQL